LQLATSVIPAAPTSLVFLMDLPAQVISGIGPRILGAAALNSIVIDSTTVNFAGGGVGSASVTGLASDGRRRIAALYTSGAPSRLSVNGSAVAVGTDTGPAYPPAPFYLGNTPSLNRPLNGSLGIFAVYPGNPTDAQLQAMSAL
jgi:hypothetical protein